MNTSIPTPLQLQLEDVLGEMLYARRENDLGRLALLTYWDVRKWARRAQRQALAELASDLFTGEPYASREEFLARVDVVIEELIRIGGSSDGRPCAH